MPGLHMPLLLMSIIALGWPSNRPQSSKSRQARRKWSLFADRNGHPLGSVAAGGNRNDGVLERTLGAVPTAPHR